MLSEAELQRYHDDGFVVVRGLVPPAEISAMRDEVANLHERMQSQPIPGVGLSWEEGNGPRRIKQLMNSELVSPALNRALRSPAMLAIVGQILGPDVALFHSKLLLKSSGVGTAVPWHQDYAYWKSEDNRPLMINCQIAIDAADAGNGCIQFVPGSHQQGLLPHLRAARTFGVFIDERYYFEREDAVTTPLAPGDGVFFSCLVVHGSPANESLRDRRMNTFAYNVTGNGKRFCREALVGCPLPIPDAAK
jgi:phytanoyl-CoA hydroxylase